MDAEDIGANRGRGQIDKENLVESPFADEFRRQRTNIVRRRNDEDLAALFSHPAQEGAHHPLAGPCLTTPAGKALFQMLGVFAEFERSIIKERVLAGLARARASGKRLGRPRVNVKTEASVLRALREGASQRQAAAKCGVGLGTVSKIKAAAEAEAA